MKHLTGNISRTTAALPESIHLWGETLSLDFANTVDWSADDEHVDATETDVLREPAMLLTWGQRLGLLAAADMPVPDADEWGRARELRDATYRVFAALATGRPAPTDDLRTVHDSYAEAVTHGGLVADAGVYRFTWDPHDVRAVRLAVAHDAAMLLQDPERLARVTRCPGRGCGWLFLNLSGRRRWCSMSTCGSREKMRRQRQRS